MGREWARPLAVWFLCRRVSCPKCGAQMREPCRNYLKQPKQHCPDRQQRALTQSGLVAEEGLADEREAAPLTQGLTQRTLW